MTQFFIQIEFEIHLINKLILILIHVVILILVTIFLWHFFQIQQVVA